MAWLFLNQVEENIMEWPNIKKSVELIDKKKWNSSLLHAFMTAFILSGIDF